MKRDVLITIIIFLITSSFSAPIQYKSISPKWGTFGFGPIAGTHPWFGVTTKFWFTDQLAFDAVFGYRSDFHLETNFTYNKRFFNLPNGDMRITLGGGLFSETPTEDAFGIQAIGGTEWFIPWEPISLFLQYLPAVNFNPKGDNVFQAVNFNFGARYYF